MLFAASAAFPLIGGSDTLHHVPAYDSGLDSVGWSPLCANAIMAKAKEEQHLRMLRSLSHRSHVSIFERARYPFSLQDPEFVAYSTSPVAERSMLMQVGHSSQQAKRFSWCPCSLYACDSHRFRTILMLVPWFAGSWPRRTTRVTFVKSGSFRQQMVEEVSDVARPFLVSGVCGLCKLHGSSTPSIPMFQMTKSDPQKSKLARENVSLLL